jgi:hypothetical protein
MHNDRLLTLILALLYTKSDLLRVNKLCKRAGPEFLIVTYKINLLL